MAKQELYDKSPIRAYDDLTGGLKAGEIGLVTAKRGLGKTSVLVQFGMDTLLNGKQLVHVSFDQHSSNVITWYDGIFTEISKKKALDSDLKDTILRNRTILNFNQENVNLEKVVTTLNALKAGGINVAGIVIDNVDMDKVKESDLMTVSSYAKATKCKIWMSSTVESDVLKEQAPKALLPYFNHVVHLSAKGTNTILTILAASKGESSELKLDSKTLLIGAK